MYLSKIKIINFRGINLQELAFTRFSTLVGKNDCGKSTIINAIKLFFNDEKANRKDFNFYTKDTKDIEIEIEVSDYDPELLKTYIVGGEKTDGFEVVVKDFVHNSILRLKKTWKYSDAIECASTTYIFCNDFVETPIHKISTQKEITKIVTELEIEIPVSGVGENSILEKKAAISNKLVQDNKPKVFNFLEIKANSLKGLRDCLPRIELLKADQTIETTTTEFKSTFTTEIKEIIKNEKSRGGESSLKIIEETIQNKIREEALEIKNCMSHHISDLSDLLITPSFDWYKGVEITNVELKLEGDDEYIPLENKGSGYRRLFMVGRLRYLANKKQSENVIYLIEEPETFLHPSAQEEMLESLISLSDHNQIFVTTHSPVFAGATKNDSLTLCKKVNSNLIYEQRDDNEFLLDIAKQLGVKPMHNISDTYKAIIFVEGSNDREFIRISSQKLGSSVHALEDEKQIAILDGGGQSLQNFVDLDYFTTHDKHLFLIIDSDIYDSEQITETDKRNSFDKKQEENIALRSNFENKNKSKGFILKKRNIDSYYHPKALKRLIASFPEVGIFKDNFCYKTYVQKLLKDRVVTENIPQKNYIAAFNEMTSQEWVEVSNNELETMFGEIISRIQQK